MSLSSRESAANPAATLWSCLPPKGGILLQDKLPSCAQRRALDFGEWVVEEVIPGIPVVSCTFTIPKMLRIYFRFDHSLYPELSRCAWETMKECFQAAFDTVTLVPGMITGIHSAGKILNFHPHVHALASAGCFDVDGTFHCISCIPDKEQLEKLFMHKVLKMMMSLDKIDEDVVERLTSWTFSGFNVHDGEIIPPEDTNARERATRYLVRSCVSLERMTYISAVVPELTEVNLPSALNADSLTFFWLGYIVVILDHEQQGDGNKLVAQIPERFSGGGADIHRTVLQRFEQRLERGGLLSGRERQGAST